MSSPGKKADKPLTPRQAWQPFTPRGIAAFAAATLTRLTVAQLAVASIVAIAVVQFLSAAWFPVVTEAIHNLPPTGEIRGAILHFGSESPVRLAENQRLALVVDMDRTGNAGHIADCEIMFEKSQLALCGALGCWRVPYFSGYTIDFNRPGLEPSWGAWRGPLLGLAALATVLAMFLMWWAAAMVYAPLVKLIAFYGDRVVTWQGAGRLSAAALLPGALIVALAILLYSFGAVDLPRLALLYAIHVAAGLIFVVSSALFLPKIGDHKIGKNPFSQGATK